MRDTTQWPLILHLKIGLVGILLVLTLAHDLLLGPRIGRIRSKRAGEQTRWERILVRTSPWLPRVSLLTALAVVVAAVAFARS